MKSILISTAILLLLSCVSTQKLFSQDQALSVSGEQMDDESAVKAAVEEFLLALGSNDFEALPGMFLPNANMGSIKMKEGKTSIYTNSVAEWLAERSKKENKLFEEPVQEYTVEITQGLLAFVRANTTLVYGGVPNHIAHDFFILMKDDGQWKILSGSYTNLPLVNE
jgi:hypothetical protein